MANVKDLISSGRILYVDLVASLINFKLAKDERSARSQIDGGNVRIGYYARPRDYEVVFDGIGYRGNKSLVKVEEVVPKKKYAIPITDILGKVLLVGSKTKYTPNDFDVREDD